MSTKSTSTKVSRPVGKLSVIGGGPTCIGTTEVLVGSTKLSGVSRLELVADARTKRWVAVVTVDAEHVELTGIPESDVQVLISNL